MREAVLDLDAAVNGTPGCGERLFSLCRSHGVELALQQVLTEQCALHASGDIPALDSYRRAYTGDAEWAEACLALPETRFCGRRLAPQLVATGLRLAGAAINLPRRELSQAGFAPGVTETGIEQALVIGGRGGAAYGHWLLDFVPQLLTGLECLRRRGCTDTPIVVINSQPFCRELLELMGVHERCIFPGRSEMLRIRRPFLPLIAKLRTRYAVSALRRGFAHLKAAALASPGIEAPRAPVPPAPREAAAAAGTGARGRIAIERSRAPRAANAAAVLGNLAQFGFVPLNPEQHGIAAQIRLFADAEIVAGEDGSALHNAGFCRPGGTLLVAARGDKTNFWHGAVACAAGLHLHYVASEVTASEAPAYRLRSQPIVAFVRDWHARHGAAPP